MFQPRTLQKLSLATVPLALFALGGCRPSADSEPEPTSPVAEEAAPETPAQEAIAEPTPADGPLAGTHWRLVQFQSMDDSVGIVTPEDPALYTMSLAADGSASFRLNCNRGQGTWSSEASDSGDSGSFELGPLAMTRALCPPPSMDEKIANDAQYLRSYILRDGQLHLSLMADGGIYSWEPWDPEAATDATADSDAE